MEKQDFNLKAFNDSFSAALEGSELDFGKMLVQAYDEDLSVTGKYAPPRERVVFGDGLAPVTVERADEEAPFYYGVSPLLDTGTVMRLLSRAAIFTPEALDGFIAEKKEWFMLHAGQGEYLLPMARYIVLSVAAHFGLRVSVSGELYTCLEEQLKGAGLSGRALAAMLAYDEKKAVVTVRGFITEQLLDILNGFSFDPAEQPREGGEAAAGFVMKRAGEGKLTIAQVYSSGVALVRGRVFYSGALLRPTHIEVLENSRENDRVRSICIHFERSTYGACCALDGNLTAHPLLGECRGRMIELLKKDDALKRRLKQDIGDLPDPENKSAKALLGAVNDYLEKSFNVNQIGVSANIVSQNGYLLLGRRNAASIDEGKLYPGVNGNAEVADRNVSFYGLSVYEDYPTINVDADRIDFFGEIGRETFGELHQDLAKQEWICYGMIISGNMPKDAGGETDGYDEPFRRMHFNLIFEHACGKTMSEIELAARQAAEAFETKSFLGIAVHCEKNRGTHALRSAARAVSALVNQQDFVESLLALIVFLPAVGRFIDALRAHERIGTALKSLFTEGWTGTVAIVLAALVVLWTLYRVARLGVRSFASLNKVRSLRLYSKTPYGKVDGMLEKKLRMRTGKYLLLSARRSLMRALGKETEPIRRKYVFHPAAYAALRAYIDNKAHDTFFMKDRR
ncbi:MAG: hypothetical protein II191_00770 [Clostridia bacterium]|nr:hypothetical protein [Clostridia bacterium]